MEYAQQLWPSLHNVQKHIEDCKYIELQTQFEPNIYKLSSACGSLGRTSSQENGH